MGIVYYCTRCDGEVRPYDLHRDPCWDCLQAEVKRLKAALPKTKDGVTLVPGMEVFVVRIGDGSVFPLTVLPEPSILVRCPDATTVHSPAGRFFSTRAAAEAAGSK